MHSPLRRGPLAAFALFVLAGCGSLPQAPTVANATLPEAVRVPDGHRQTAYTVGIGEITYECREKKGMADQHEWAFVAPVAALTTVGGKNVGRYYAGPTWEGNDGSQVTGKQVAVSPASPGNIPLQLVKADPSKGKGMFEGVSFIQRLNTEGGVAPALPCGMGEKGQKQQVRYKADYVIYKPAM